MKGIAEGDGVDFASILTLNCSSEEMFAKASVPEDTCSAIAVPPEASGNGRTDLGQNWDWWPIGRGTTVLLEVEQKPFARCLIVTEAGLVGGKGMNEFGLGLTMSALSVKKGRAGVPVQVLLRAALSQRTVPKAIEAIEGAKRAGAACIGLASGDGLAVMVEAAPVGLDVLTGGGRPLCHTNHWLSERLAAGPEAIWHSYSSTFTRLDRIRRLSALEAGSLRRKALFRIFSDHAGCPDSVCRHDDEPLPEYHRHCSLWSLVMDLSERTLWLTEGSPCCTAARPYRL